MGSGPGLAVVARAHERQGRAARSGRIRRRGRRAQAWAPGGRATASDGSGWAGACSRGRDRWAKGLDEVQDADPAAGAPWGRHLGAEQPGQHPPRDKERRPAGRNPRAIGVPQPAGGDEHVHVGWYSSARLPLRRRPSRPMTGTRPEIPTWRTRFATNSNMLSRPSRAIPTRGRVMHSGLDDTSSHGFPSAPSTGFVTTRPKSSRSLTPSGGQDIGDPVCDPVVRPSNFNFTLHQTARSRCSLAAGERARWGTQPGEREEHMSPRHKAENHDDLLPEYDFSGAVREHPSALREQGAHYDHGSVFGFKRSATWFDDQGAGDPLVLSHPGLVDSRAFGPNLGAFAARFRTFTPERRGHGHTPDVGRITFELMAEGHDPLS
jgi:hypothetical protein